jgi:hypothetical protein
MIWILALLCLGLAGLVGFYQGPIRGAFSLIGLLLASILTIPLAPMIKPLLPLAGVKDPIWLQILPPVVMLLIILIACGMAGAAVHRAVFVKFKYDQEDARFYRWERVSTRVGLCLGLVNGAVYFIMILVPIYVGGYFTLQLAPGDSAPASVKLINTIRTSIQDTKMDRVLAAYDPTPAPIYQAADTVALIAQNPDLETRLARYPIFLSLAERKAFQDLAADPDFQKKFSGKSTVAELLQNPKVQAILADPNLTKELVDLIGSNLGDLNAYLRTGKSPKYENEKILGCWTINTQETLIMAKKKLSNMTVKQAVYLKNTMTPKVAGLLFTATTDNMAILKKANPASPAMPTVIVKGTWQKSTDGYAVTLPGANPDTVQPVLENDNRLLLPKDGDTLVFDRD